MVISVNVTPEQEIDETEFWRDIDALNRLGPCYSLLRREFAHHLIRARANFELNQMKQKSMSQTERHNFRQIRCRDLLVKAFNLGLVDDAVLF